MKAKRNILEGKLQPPVGCSDWATFSRDRYCVDKTLLIKDLVDSKTTVALFTRPRRFGKTSAMEMLRAFFEKDKEDTSYLFTDKKIWASGDKYRAMQGKYPVIYLTFKDHKADTWEDATGSLIRDISREVGRHNNAVKSEWAETPTDYDQLISILNRSASIHEVSDALRLLAAAIHHHHGIKPIILIDEYDTPISTASSHGYYDKMITFMRIFLSGALKDNKHCEMGVITGITRVAKEGIFSGLNNLAVWTVFDSEFSEYFGFTKDEVRAMAEYYGVPRKVAEIRRWYDGYNFGGTEIYNPWSVLNYFARNCKPAAYWLDTSSNDLITKIVKTYPHDLVRTFEALLRDEKPKVRMATELGPYAEVVNNADTLYCLLVSAGYLTVASRVQRGQCAVQIPNKELSMVFENEIKSKICRAYAGEYGDIDRAIIDNDMSALQKAIASFLKESVSYFDTAAEGFFHGLTLGFLATLRDCYRVESNAESGDGRFDIALYPRSAKYPGFVIEVKAADAEEDNLDALAKSALEQITTKDYTVKMAAEFQANGYTQPLVKIGLAYFKKRVVLVQADGN